MLLLAPFGRSTAIKGFIYSLSHGCQSHTDHDVSITYCGSSVGDSIDLLSTSICTTMDVSDWCITNPTYGSWKCVMEQLASEDAAADIS